MPAASLSPYRPSSYAPSVYQRYGIYTLTEADREAFVEHLLRLDSDARVLRFGAPLHDDVLEAFARRFPLDDGNTVGLYIWGELRGSASAVQNSGQPGYAEFAISLLPSLKGRGWGHQMTRFVFLRAYMAGLSFIDVHYLRSNTPMARIVSKYPGVIHLEGSDAHKEVDLEAWAEQQGAACLLA